MAILTKPCNGTLSEETLTLLQANRERAAWGVYPCEVCGQNVGVLEEKGKWVPERHWPSVTYSPRRPAVSRYSRQ